jgi:hypothetical protein
MTGPGGPWPLLGADLAAIAILLGIIRRLRGRPGSYGLALALKVFASWLIAIAVLVASLSFLPVTPGYQPDHLE